MNHFDLWLGLLRGKKGFYFTRSPCCLMRTAQQDKSLVGWMRDLVLGFFYYFHYYNVFVLPISNQNTWAHSLRVISFCMYVVKVKLSDFPFHTHGSCVGNQRLLPVFLLARGESFAWVTLSENDGQTHAHSLGNTFFFVFPFKWLSSSEKAFLFPSPALSSFPHKLDSSHVPWMLLTFFFK